MYPSSSSFAESIFELRLSFAKLSLGLSLLRTSVVTAPTDGTQMYSGWTYSDGPHMFFNVPIKLCKTAGSICMLKIIGMLKPENVQFKMKLHLGYNRNRLERRSM